MRFETAEELADWLGVDPHVLVGGVDLQKGARLLGIGVSTLRMRALNGEIGYRRDGRRWVFNWRHLADYVASRQQSSCPDGGASAG